MLTVNHVWRWGIFWGILINLLSASKSLTSLVAQCTHRVLDTSLPSCAGDYTRLVSPYVDLFHCFTSADCVAVVAGKLSGNGVSPRYLNTSGLLPPASSSLDSASTLLPQAPADYCGLCIIEAPGGIRLVYWVCISSVTFLLFRFPFQIA